jgi:energy-coupling factor transport system ATP-binding protein
VRPPGLGHALELLGIDAQAKDVDQALEEILRKYPRLAKTLIENRAESRPTPPTATTAAPAFIGIENVSFSYAGGPLVLDSIDLKVEAGEFLAIVGQNGSGKTTLAKQIVGLLHPAKGRVTIDGKDRSQMRPAETAREVAYVFQNPDNQIFSATVEDEVAFGPRNFGLADDEIRHRCDEALEAVGLQNERQSDPFLLSKGERQRLAVASVLVLRPRMLILDEPTTGLDHREQLRMMALVRDLNRAGIAIVIITHTPWLVAEYARRVVLMRKGAKIFDGGVREFFMQDELLRSSSFRAPEITELSRRFGTLALTTEEFVTWVKGRA